MALPAPGFQDEITRSMNALQRLYPNTFDANKYFYLPHGKYSFAAGCAFQGKSGKELQLHSQHSYSSIYARAGVIGGFKVTCLLKTWDISRAWREFFQELYFYSHPDLLRWLQGIVVPHVISIHHEPDGQKSILMEVPHHIHWHTASTHLPIGEKERIVRAYEKLHAHGIMHNNISFHNIFIDQDMNVTLVNFETARCINDKGIGEVPLCDQGALKREMRRVKYLIDYMGARIMEREVLTASQAGASHCKQMEPLSMLDMDFWDQLASDREVTYTIPSDMRNRPLPNDGRKKARPLKKGSQKIKAAMSSGESELSGFSINQVASKLGVFTQDVAGSERPPNPNPLLAVRPPSAYTPSLPLLTPADIREFFSIDQLPLSLSSTSFDGDTSNATERDTNMQFLPSDPDSGPSQAVSGSRYNYWLSASSPASFQSLPSKLPPLNSDVPAQPPHAPQSSLLVANTTSRGLSDHSYPDRPPSPKVFCDLTHEQLRLAIKQHNAAVDAKLTSQPPVNTDKTGVIFHPDTNDNSTYATGSDLFRKRKKKRRLTPFYHESSYFSEQETSSDEGEEGEEPEPHIEIDFNDLFDEAQLAKARGHRHKLRPGVLPSMASAKPLHAEFASAARCSARMLPSPTLTPISEEKGPPDGSGTPPYTVVFVGASGSPDEVWQLPVSAFMFVKSVAAKQPQAKNLRVEQVHRLQAHPPTNPFSLLASSNQIIHSQTSKKRKFDCVEGIEYLDQRSKCTRQDTTPSSCVIC